MTHPNFDAMSREELRAYLLEHRNSEEVFQAYMDRMTSEPVLAHGSPEDLADLDRFAAVLEQVKQLKRARKTQGS
ncbi:MAG TPA: hypothetical protein V6C88_03845 [Chroococcidiopsis sp.]